MTIVDAHHHLWDPDAGEYPWMTGEFAVLRRRYDLEDLRPHLLANDVSATIVVQVRADAAETAELLELSSCATVMVGVVGWADLTSNSGYMRFYDISFLDRLVNNLFVENDTGRSRLSVGAYYFQGLRATDVQGFIPYVLPQLDYTFIPDSSIAGDILASNSTQPICSPTVVSASISLPVC